MMDEPLYQAQTDKMSVVIYHDMPFRIKLPPMPKEPRIPISPYAKFDKFHHKKKRK